MSAIRYILVGAVTVDKSLHNCFVITANFVAVAIALNFISAEAGECWHKTESVFV